MSDDLKVEPMMAANEPDAAVLTPTILIMAGGTGGHIMPGLAVADELRQRGWNVYWLGNPDRMEGELVPARGFQLLPMSFAGLRGKGFSALLKLPFALAGALNDARKAFKQVKPDVVLGMGGYAAFPGSVVAFLSAKPIVLHEQNAVAGTANKVISKLAKRVLMAFPKALSKGTVVGNPVRAELLNLAMPVERFANREGPLRLLVVGGSLGALALNNLIPEAIAQISPEQRPLITHQSGSAHLEILKNNYSEAGVEANCVAFIDNMANALAEADLLICRAGAMTVAEVAAVGVPALFVPLPGAIDDHQTANARWLADAGAAEIKAQSALSAQWLAKWLVAKDRNQLLEIATAARAMALPGATHAIADVCEQLARD
ncbi:MAG: undecaprenyldiphospho-muramoylpentapeptide beta-N-acetylglucosaminyltransferase [Alcaligenaceae bacterium]|jgi:UDP-N-acetylglucosamine--N-acetylmuramyl-(pentapeptide) pyrophosphoryl-undecaprenol N-acetylglucosamine transferase|nr:undecaprenyldiphospho-muramoylpentapeptide beta-N-acetylglucosaminyltransferase [Alcaligenaceae bacterium]